MASCYEFCLRSLQLRAFSINIIEMTSDLLCIPKEILPAITRDLQSFLNSNYDLIYMNNAEPQRKGHLRNISGMWIRTFVEYIREPSARKSCHVRKRFSPALVATPVCMIPLSGRLQIIPKAENFYRFTYPSFTVEHQLVPSVPGPSTDSLLRET